MQEAAAAAAAASGGSCGGSCGGSHKCGHGSAKSETFDFAREDTSTAVTEPWKEEDRTTNPIWWPSF